MFRIGCIRGDELFLQKEPWGDSMIKLPMFYALKSLLPRSAQIRVRQAISRRKRASVGDVWPILESAGTPPEGWAGWPDGKKFALVFTHDVEMTRGVERCRMVMDTEERHGFRSAFYIVPERYKVPSDVREEMVRRGFEVGVHGLYHDLSLYHSEKEFARQAQIINGYVKEWGAVGFRSPYMMRNLAWIRDYLNIEYDSSSFDTDPFEPQPYGVGTIFPFIVDGIAGERPGYVELPCTLPQDLNLFVLLGEGGIDVWKRKLDWIASRGGVALFDTHPDYMQDKKGLASDEYPLRLYEEFFEYVQARYEGQYWQALPREVASFCRGHSRNVRHGIPRRVCMAAYAFYDSDGRIMRYAETLVKAGHSVDAISLGRAGQPRREVINGVRVDRIQTRKRDEELRLTYLFRTVRFFLKSFLTLARKHIRAPYDLVHVHSVPDFEVFAAWYPKWHGARVILDIHDLVPEFYASKFRIGRMSVIPRILLLVERLSARFSDHVIIANHIWRETLVRRSVPGEKCSVVLNNVDPAVFFPRMRMRSDSRFVIVYPGGLQWHQGVDIAIRAFARIADRVPQAEFHIYGDGSERESLVKLIHDLHMEERIQLKAPVSFCEIPDIMANSDLGVVAKRADSFGNEAYSTKIMEYMSQGVPVIVSRTKIDTFYFDDSAVRFFPSGNVDELADSMLAVMRDPDLRRRLREQGLSYVEKNNWSSRKHEYLELVERLCNRRPAK